MTAMDFDHEFSTPQDWANMYRLQGWQVIPAMSPRDVPAGKAWKRPAVESWREHEEGLVSNVVFAQWFGGSSRTNMGMITGHASGNVGVIDLDTHKVPEAGRKWLALLELHNNGLDLETPTQQTGGGGVQMFFRFHPGFKIPTCKTPVGIDIRGQGGFAMLPPSTHESRNRYAWVEGLAPWEIDVLEAPEWLEEWVHTLTVQYGAGGASSASRGEKTASPAYDKDPFGHIVDGREDYMTKLVWAFVVDMYRDAPIMPTADVIQAEGEEAFARYERNVKARLIEPETSNADLLEREGRGRSLFWEKVAAALRQWDTTVCEAAKVPKEPIEPDPTPEPAQEVLPPHDPETGEIIEFPMPTPAPQIEVVDPWEEYPVPEFPVDVFPAKIAQYARVTAISTGGDVSTVAMTILAYAAGALHQGFRLRMKNSGTWLVPPRLWVMLIGDPSSKKTPIIDSCGRPLRDIENRGREAYRKAMAAWKKDGKAAGEEEPEKPIRYTLDSVTTEKVGDILSRQDRGILVKPDELSGWIGSMDSYRGRGGQADMAFWATAYNGHGFGIDRVGRGEVYVNNLCVSIIGGIQPATLGRADDLIPNGLLQRFLPVMMRPGRLPEEVDDAMARVAWEQMVQRLEGLAPSTMTATDGAMRAFREWQETSNNLQRSPGLLVALQNFFGKLDGIHGSLALILHLMDGRDYEPVSESAARRALRIIEQFIVPHAIAFYDSLSSRGGALEELRSIASFVLSSDKTRFTGADFTRVMRGLRNLTQSELAAKISPLVVGGWLTEDTGKGVLVRAWIMNPGVREQLAARREQQQRARAEVAAILKRYRDGKKAVDHE